MISEIKGDLVKLAKEGKFDVIAHGCNCFCKMKRGLAPQMAEAFGCDKFRLESTDLKLHNGKPFNEGEINKLGQIDYEQFVIDGHRRIFVVNAYTQYHWDTKTKPLDYDALTLCLRKMNVAFKGLHVGLPQIGCHLAGGDWNLVRPIIEKELKDCKVTIVIYDPTK